MKEKCIAAVKDPDGITVQFFPEDFEAISETVSKETIIETDETGSINLKCPQPVERSLTLGFEAVWKSLSDEPELRIIARETGMSAACSAKMAAEAIVSYMNRPVVTSSLFEEPYLMEIRKRLEEKGDGLRGFGITLENGRADIYGRGRIEAGGTERSCVAAFDRIHIEVPETGSAEIILRNCVGTAAAMDNLEDPVCTFVTGSGKVLEFKPDEITREKNPVRRIFSCVVKSEAIHIIESPVQNWTDKEVFYDMISDNEEEYIKEKAQLITKGGNRDAALARSMVSALVSFRKERKRE